MKKFLLCSAMLFLGFWAVASPSTERSSAGKSHVESSPPAKPAEPSSIDEKSEYLIPRRIQYGFSIQNTTNRVIERAHLWAYAPVKQTSTQKCIRLETTHAHETITDSSGNQILHFTIEKLPPYGTRIISVRGDLMLSDRPNKAADSAVYLKPERYIESDHPKIVCLAQSLKDKNPQYKTDQATERTARKTFEWVSRNIQYSGSTGDDLGALYALKHRKGDCTESAYLFAALCRANAIPARVLGGYMVDRDSVIDPNKYHNWAEYYDQSGWNIADPQANRFRKDQSRYIAFNIIGGALVDQLENSIGRFHRFRYSDEGLRVAMNP